MNSNPPPPSRRFLTIYVSREPEGARVRIPPQQLPKQLRRFFDRNGEAYPMPFLDLADLERHVSARGGYVDKRPTAGGSVVLSAEGPNVPLLLHWLATAFESGFR